MDELLGFRYVVFFQDGGYTPSKVCVEVPREVVSEKDVNELETAARKKLALADDDEFYLTGFQLLSRPNTFIDED